MDTRIFVQELLKNRRLKLQLTEDLMEQKSTEIKRKEKQIDLMKRKENYVEKIVVEKLVFDKKPSKKKK